MARAHLLAASAASLYWAPGILGYTRAAKLVGIHRRTSSHEAVALSFDDGPQPQATDHFLHLLERLDARATFFLVGEQVRRSAALVREIHSAGHEIANHGYRHRNHAFRNPIELMEDLRQGARAIEDVTGQSPQLFRPPQGFVTAATRRAARAEGHAIVLWSLWGRDWRPRATPDSICRDALKGAKAGSILLLHDADYYSGRTWHATFEAVPRIVAELRGRGLNVAPIGGRSALA